MKKLYHYLPMMICSVFAAIFFIIFQICFFVSQVMLKPELYSEAMGRNDVAEAMYTELDTYFEQYSIPSNIPKEVFMECIDKSDLSAAAYHLISDSLEYLTDSDAAEPQITYDFTAVDAGIIAYFEEYTEENGIVRNEEYDKMLKTTIDTAHEQVESKIDVMMLHAFSQTDFAGSIHKYVNLINIGAVVSAAIVAVLLVVMVYIDRRHPRDLSYWFGTTLFCSSATLLIPAVYLENTGFFQSFFMKSENIFRTVTGMLQSALDKVIFSQTVMLLISVLLIAVTLVVHIIYRAYRTRRHFKED